MVRLMYRKTYAKINGDHLKENVMEIKKKYSGYEYYFGVVKNNAYHHGIKVIQDLIAGGINYLAVSSLEEAIDARKYHQDIPILCLEPIHAEYVHDCINSNITLTIDSYDYARKLSEVEIAFSIKVHLKIDSGMNRIGIQSKNELNKIMELFKGNKRIVIEGIYSHFATSGIADKNWDNQVDKFLEITKDVDLSLIPIVHLGRSLTLVNHKKIEFCNGIRLGIIMFGHAQSVKQDRSLKGKLKQFKVNYLKKKLNISETILENDLKLKTSFSLYSEVIHIHKVKVDDVIGYNANYKVSENGYVAVLPIGYADGVTKQFGNVWIGNKAYPIIADSMDMLMILVDKSVKLGDKVEIFGQNISIKEVCKNVGISAYQLYNQIQNRVPRIHVTEHMKEEIKY